MIMLTQTLPKIPFSMFDAVHIQQNLLVTHCTHFYIHVLNFLLTDLKFPHNRSPHSALQPDSDAQNMYISICGYVQLYSAGSKREGGWRGLKKWQKECGVRCFLAHSILSRLERKESSTAIIYLDRVKFQLIQRIIRIHRVKFFCDVG